MKYVVAKKEDYVTLFNSSFEINGIKSEKIVYLKNLKKTQYYKIAQYCKYCIIENIDKIKSGETNGTNTLRNRSEIKRFKNTN